VNIMTILSFLETVEYARGAAAIADLIARQKGINNDHRKMMTSNVNLLIEHAFIAYRQLTGNQKQSDNVKISKGILEGLAKRYGTAWTG